MHCSITLRGLYLQVLIPVEKAGKFGVMSGWLNYSSTAGWPIRRVRDLPCADYRIYLDLEVRRVDCRRCGAVKRERLEFLVDNALHTKRFALYVGRRCRSTAITDVAKELNLDWHMVKRLEMVPSEIRRKPERPNVSNVGSARCTTCAQPSSHPAQAPNSEDVEIMAGNKSSSVGLVHLLHQIFFRRKVELVTLVR